MEERSTAGGRAEEGGSAQPIPGLRTGAALPAPLRRIVLAAWLPALAWLTLTPVPRSENPDEPMSRWCLVCGDRGTADAILNVGFFVPLGVALANGRLSPLRALAIGAAVSLAVEAAQIVVPGRYATPGDVLWNGLGALAGLLAAGLAVRPVASRSPWAAPFTAVLVAGGFVVSGALLEHAPTRADYYGQWTADLGHMPEYGGEVVSAYVDGLRMPNSRIDPAVDAAARLAADWAIEARIVKGPPPEFISPIISVYDAEEAEILVLGAYSEDLVLRERTRAKALRLDHPDLRLDDGLARHTVGEALTIGARREGPTRCLSVNTTETCGLGFTPGRTWGLLLYLEGPPESYRVALDATWVFALFLPIGLLATSVPSLAGAGAIALLGLPLSALTTRLLPPTAWELAAACGGLAVGWVAARIVDGTRTL